MSATLNVSEIVRGWSDAERKQALTEIIGDRRAKGSDPFFIEEVGYLMPIDVEATLVEFDDSTPYLREMRRRAETPEDSEIIMELDLPDVEAPEDRGS